MNINQFEAELQNHPDKDFVSFIVNGLRQGFDTLIPNLVLPNKEFKNLLSARKEPEVIDELIDQECKKGYLYGPFNEPPFESYRVSPLGLAVGKYSGKKRLIVDLSSPHEDAHHVSVNDLIDKDSCSLTYVKLDDAIKAIRQHGPGALMCKIDVTDAFKQLAIKPSQWPFFCVKWRQLYYVFVRLTFGCRSSPKLFDTIAQAISWIASNNYGIATIFHLLDDFLTVDKPDLCTGQRTMALLTMLFSRLKVPLAKHKCIGPADCLEYLGIILDSKNMVAKLPLDKVGRIIKFIEILLGKNRCTKRELLQLLGHLNFASRVILPGRSFVSYLISLSTTVSNLQHFVYLDSHCQQDLYMWHKFLQDWNGVSLFYDSNFTNAYDMELFTDASLVGFGAYFQNHWFSTKWPDCLPSIHESDLSMAFRELYPIVAAAVLWGKHWTSKRIMFISDNEATVYIIKKMRSKCLPIMKLMRTLTWTAAVNNFHFSAKHLAGKLNTVADHLSRLSLQKFRECAPQADQYPQVCPPPEHIIWDTRS